MGVVTVLVSSALLTSAGFVGLRHVLKGRHDRELALAKECVVQEAQHSIKNSLQITSSLIRRKLRADDLSESQNMVLDELNDEILLFGCLFDHLVTRDGTLHVEFSAFIDDLLSKVQVINSDQLHFEGRDKAATVSLITASNIALILIEFLTDVTRSGPQYKVSLDYHLSEGRDGQTASISLTEVDGKGQSSRWLSKDLFKRPTLADLLDQSSAEVGALETTGATGAGVEISIPIVQGRNCANAACHQ